MAFYKIDNDSLNSITNALDFFQIPPTNVSVSSAKTFEILPSNPLSDTPYHFKIHSSDNYIDLSKCFLYTEFRIQKLNAGVLKDLEATDNVAPIQMLGNTFIKDMRISVNGREIFNSNSLMAYKSYLTHELSYSTEAKKSHLTAAGYALDTKDDDTLETGTGFTTLKEMFSLSKSVQMMSKLDADIFNQELYLINHCGMDITIMPNDGNFMLIAPDANITYQLELLSCKLYVKKISLLDGLAMDIAKKLDLKPVRYAVRKSMMKSFFISAGHFEYNANLFQDQIPRRIILGLVANTDYVGNVKTSPFNFKHFDVREISVIANGRQYPQAPYELDYENGKYVRPFHDMNDAIGFVNTGGGNSISYTRYGKTHCIYVFNLTNSGEDQGGMFDLIKNGTTAVNIKFKKQVPTGGVMLVVFGEVDSLIMLDKNRTISSDTTI